ncbi:hypothetical protein [Natrinema marinum]|uniref:hypothetical protein n=1 Tax=Natrinema marinum TaxID=2961598 RepID=UPI0020C868D0|nr:hypothetical protein [Natrinema marinum]
MRIRTPASDRAESSSSTESTADTSFGGRLARYALVAGGVLALAYAARRIRSSSGDGDGIRSVDEFQERAAEAVPDELSEPVATIPIGEPGDESETEASTADEGSDTVDETETNAAFADERADADASADPAEPGEMAVDEEIADELVEDELEAESEDEGDEESAASEE